MAVLHCVSSASLSGTWLLGQAGFGAHIASTMYQDNPYIRRLNQMLDREARAHLSYLTLQRRGAIVPGLDGLEEAVEHHGKAQRTLVRLIARNSGLPEDPSAWKSRFQKAILDLSQSAPRGVQSRATQIYFGRLESSLTSGYRQTIAFAPRKDQEELAQLMEQAAALERQLGSTQP